MTAPSPPPRPATPQHNSHGAAQGAACRVVLTRAGAARAGATAGCSRAGDAWLWAAGIGAGGAGSDRAAAQVLSRAPRAAPSAAVSTGAEQRAGSRGGVCCPSAPAAGHAAPRADATDAQPLPPCPPVTPAHLLLVWSTLASSSRVLTRRMTRPAMTAPTSATLSSTPQAAPSSPWCVTL